MTLIKTSQIAINTKGFTPMGENLPKSDVSNLIACPLTGPNVLRPTTLFVEPKKLLLTQQKYQAQGATLSIPDWAWAKYGHCQLDKTQPIPVPVAHEPRRKMTSSRPVICLNTGTFYDSANQAASRVGLSPQLLIVHLSGGAKQAKGRRMRYATTKEIEQYDTNPHWQYAGELLPIIQGGKRKF